MGDLSICEPQEERFNVWNQTFTDGDTGKAALFHSFLPHVLEIAQPDFTRETLQSMGLYARCPGSIKRLSIFLWLKHSISIAPPMSPRTLGNGLFRVTMQPYVRLLKNPQFGDNSANASRVLVSNIPSFAHC